MTDSTSATTDVHPLDRALELTPTEPGVWRGRTTADYWNMVGPFGGVTAATLLRAVQLHPDVLGEPLALTVNFAGPIEDGEFEVRAEPVRTNNTNQHWTLELRQGDEVLTTGTMLTGVRRDTWTDVEATRPEADGPENFERYPGLPGINWVSAYDLRYVSGGLPSEADGSADDSRSTLWVRDQPARPLDHAALTAMADCFYPRAFRRRGGFVPAGTVTLTVHFLADAAEVAAHGTEHLLGTAFSRRFGRGYFDQTGELWSQDGRLLATSHQLVYFKA